MSEEKTIKAEKQHSGLYNFMSSLWRTKKVAFFSLIILILFVLVAIFADVLAPQKMQDAGSLPEAPAGHRCHGR
jgi:ABC-type antimicrobial peptide transport system permease subunit